MRNYYRRGRYLNEDVETDAILTKFDVDRINAFLKKYKLSADLLKLKVGMTVKSDTVINHRSPTSNVRLSVDRIGPFSLIIDSYDIRTHVAKVFSERLGDVVLLVNIEFDYKHTFNGGSNGKYVYLKWYGNDTQPDVYS